MTDCDLRTLVPRPPPFSIARRTRIRDWYLSSHAWRQGGKQLRYQVTYHTYLSYTPSIERVVGWTVCFCILKVVITIHYVVFVKLFANCIRLCSTVVWNCVIVGGRRGWGVGGDAVWTRLLQEVLMWQIYFMLANCNCPCTCSSVHI